MKDLKDLCRENIWNLAPYSCARTEFAGRNARVFLDANENPYNDPYNRYPDPLQVELKKQVSKIKGVAEDQIFLGNYACESAGDYASGTNHTLPTHGYALAYNGVNLDSYNRKITFQHLTEEGIRNIGDAVVTMAENEQLEAHANAMRLRVNSLK